MDHFTRAWALGELTDGEFDRVLTSYRRYIDLLDTSSLVHRFATTISLNDAWVDLYTLGSEQINLRLLTGDNQRGYWFTEIFYLDARIIKGKEDLDRAVERRPTEIWYDEFSGLPPRIHRFMLVEPDGAEDRGEVHIEFADLTFTEAPANGRALPPL